MTEPFIGEIRMFAGTFAPRSWALCDGQTILIQQNDALFSLLGTIYGGDGRTTFQLPDMRGRIPIHAGQGPGLSDRRLGAKFGSEQAAIAGNQVPVHSHTTSAASESADADQPDGALFGEAGSEIYAEEDGLASMASSMVTNAGGGLPHDNVGPFLCINFIIALFGIFPSRS